MNKAVIISLALTIALSASAQDSSQSLAATMDVFVFPSDGQDTSQQSKDEVACYEWAVGNTRTDPFALGEQEQADQQQAQADMQAAEQTGQAVAQAEQREASTAGELDNFKKAFSVCLEANEYMVKY